MKMKLSVTLFLLPALVLAGCTTANSGQSSASPQEATEIQADFPEVASAEEAVEIAENIVLAKVVSSHEEVLYPDAEGPDDPTTNPQAGLDPSEVDLDELGVPITVTTVEVLESLKGDYAVGQQIDITQIGGKMGEEEYYESSTVLLDQARGDDFVLFLTQTGDVVEPITPQLGIQSLEGNTLKAVTSESSDVSGTGMELSLEDLKGTIESVESR